MTGTREPAVYLLHGLLETSLHHFAPQVRAWKDALRVVPLDLPGHGACPLDAARPGYVAQAVRYALAVMDRFGPGHVVSASYLGGPVSVRCGLQRPDLVRTLTLTGFAPGVPGEVFSLWLDGFGPAAEASPEVRAWYERAHGPRWRATLDAYAEDVRDGYDERVAVTGEMLGRLAMPTLVANGSAKSNEREAALGAAAFGPRVRGQVISGAGHVPGRDRPEELNAIVRRFWSETQRPRRRAAAP